MAIVRLLSRGLSGRAAAGQTLLDAVRGLGFTLDQACGGQALCAECCLLVVDGEENLEPAGPAERERLASMALSDPHRLACQARLRGSAGEVDVVAC